MDDGNSMIPDAYGIEVADLSDARHQAMMAVVDGLGKRPNQTGGATGS